MLQQARTEEVEMVDEGLLEGKAARLLASYLPVEGIQGEG